MTKETKTLSNLNRSGRAKGSKNKSTLLRETLKNGFEAELEKDFIRVVRAVIEKAVDGDMTAAKLILDRAVPVTDSKNTKPLQLGEGGLVINIEQLVTQPQGQMIEASEADYEDVVETHDT